MTKHWRTLARADILVVALSLSCAEGTPKPQSRVTPGAESGPKSAANQEEKSKDVAAGDKQETQPAPVIPPADSSTPPPPAPPPASFTLTSSAFANNGRFPAQYVAKNGGGNQSPPLQWTAAPAGAASFAIQMVDLDFRTPPLIHWLITGIPATSKGIPAGIPAGNNLAQPAEAKGASQPRAYAGPNPPALHRYEITIYAIKAGETPVLGTNDSAANKRELEAKSISRSVLIGTYD